VTPLKHTWDLNRERALEALRLYEAGAKPKDLAVKLGLDSAQFWSRIQYARRLRQRAEAAE